jgi:predicted nucleotidyltransferase
VQLDIQILSGAWRDRVIFRCIAGSQAYGTATAESDRDERGIFVIPAADYLGLTEPPIQLQDERSNIVYFSLRRFLELASVANPTVLELLFMPEDCVQYYSPEMDELIAQRDLFITRQCIDTHLGYARTQIKKARGQNKWINNPQPEQPRLRRISAM